MEGHGGHILVVDDNRLNRLLLARAVGDQGHRVTTAEHGRQALSLLRAKSKDPFDLILLDILMPEMDGYQVLEQVKGDDVLRHLPVIMISAVDEMDSVLRCIEMGATDYLPKPFDASLLRARLNASLAEKRLRDLELEYLEQVGHVIDAAGSVRAAQFDPEDLDGVAARDDALGQLARVFQSMAREVHLREQRLKQQLQQLHLDMEEMRRASAEPASVYVPMDRRQALVRGETLPERTEGTALFADISGFTPLTAALAGELGRQRGAEELTQLLNQVFGALIAEVHRFGGSVIGFSGDAITCWLDGDPGLRATACGLAMQEAMTRFARVTTPTGVPFSLAIKVAVVGGPVRRFLVGDPQIQNVEVLAGRTLDRLALAEHCARSGEVLVEEKLVQQESNAITVTAWRAMPGTDVRCASVSGLRVPFPDQPWPELPPGSLSDEECRPWLLPAVYRRLCSGTKQFLAELRPAIALFLRFDGIDYDGDAEAGKKLDAFVRWVQTVIQELEGSLIQLTTGDKGSYLFATFGVPLAHTDDEVRAVNAALSLQNAPPGLDFIGDVQIGVAKGLMRTGSYGSASQRTYGVLGDKTNLAARLMQAATGGILCDDEVFQGARESIPFDALPPIAVKGIPEPVPVYRPSDVQQRSLLPVAEIQSAIDRLPPAEQLTLKVASIAGRSFRAGILGEIYPVKTEGLDTGQHLSALEQVGLIRSCGAGDAFRFASEAVHEIAYGSMLFAQRRHLHRLAAEWFERVYASDMAPHYADLARHWRAADEPDRAAAYLERAGQQSIRSGDFETAERYLQDSLELEAGSAALSAAFYGPKALNVEGAVEYALSRLEEELDPRLVYHNLFHTRDDVLPAARRLAEAMGIDDKQQLLLETGAAYHDIGFLVRRHEHERAGCDVVAEVLPRFGFAPELVTTIQGLIMATRLPQSPQTPLEQILADADLDVLGREDFVSRSRALRNEYATLGTQHTEEEWYSRQLVFLRNHRYFTEAARALRDAGKLLNIKRVQQRLDSLVTNELKGENTDVASG